MTFVSFEMSVVGASSILRNQSSLLNIPPPLFQWHYFIHSHPNSPSRFPLSSLQLHYGVCASDVDGDGQVEFFVCGFGAPNLVLKVIFPFTSPHPIPSHPIPSLTMHREVERKKRCSPASHPRFGCACAVDGESFRRHCRRDCAG